MYIKEKAKIRKYEQHVWEVEHGSFTPFVFSIFGGMAKSATLTTHTVYIQKASIPPHLQALAVVAWQQCHLNFSLL